MKTVSEGVLTMKGAKAGPYETGEPVRSSFLHQ